MDQPFYIISNASIDIYPNNTLTEFKNKFPKTLSFSEHDKWEVGVETIGLSSMFRNVLVPHRPNIPSVLIGHSFNLEQQRASPEIKASLDTHYSLNFKLFGEANTDFIPIEIKDKYYHEADVYAMCKVINTKVINECCKFSFDGSQMSIKFNNNSSREGTWVFLHETFVKSFGFSPSSTKLLSMIRAPPPPPPSPPPPSTTSQEPQTVEEAIKKAKVQLAKEDALKSLLFPFGKRAMQKQLASTFSERLEEAATAAEEEFEQRENPTPISAETTEIQTQEEEHHPSQEVYLVEINTSTFIQRKVFWDGEIYFGYYLHRDANTDFYGSLVSERIKLKNSHQLPDLIKVQCDIIEPQILNSSYSQDLLVLSTDIQYTNNYYYHDIERISYFPLLFNDISEIKIKLVDENNELLQLTRGHASIVKLRFRKNTRMTNNFYVRVTSRPSPIFPDNKPNRFSVQLPTTKILNEQWKVSLNSINIPNSFTTFIPNQNTELRTIVVKRLNDAVLSLILSDKENYTPTKLVAVINSFFRTHNLGRATLDSLGRLSFNMNYECTYGIGLNAAKILGYESGREVKNFMMIRPNSQNPYLLEFESPVNVNYFRPNYFIIYTNIVQPSVIGNQYSPILKIVPILETENAFKLHDFNVREFYSIPTTEVNEIRMELRTHDGELVNFLDNHHVIMNLQFSNEPTLN